MADVSNTLEVNYDSGSDESDGEDVQKPGSRDSNVLLDTWLKELDNLTTVRGTFNYFSVRKQSSSWRNQRGKEELNPCSARRK